MNTFFKGNRKFLTNEEFSHLSEQNAASTGDSLLDVLWLRRSDRLIRWAGDRRDQRERDSQSGKKLLERERYLRSRVPNTVVFCTVCFLVFYSRGCFCQVASDTTLTGYVYISRMSLYFNGMRDAAKHGQRCRAAHFDSDRLDLIWMDKDSSRRLSIWTAGSTVRRRCQADAWQ